MVTIRMALEERYAAPPLMDRVVGLTMFPVAVALLRCLPLRATFALAWTLKRLALRPATASEAQRVVAARNWATRWFPGRAACLEVSLAAFLISLTRGRWVDWCIGCRFRPAESHAWIEAAGQPVGEPTTPDRPFRVTVRI